MSETSKCIFCGSPLDADRQYICAACVDRYKQDHPSEFAEARLSTLLREINSDECLLCGEKLTATNPWTPPPKARIPLCDFCHELLFGKEPDPDDV